MRRGFHHHDLLRLFVEIARHASFSDAADALHMTKGAISYQIKTLESDLGVPLFHRSSRGVKLTGEGLMLLAACKTRYEDIEADIAALRGTSSQSLTVGVSTYFAARWLSPRLMSFMQSHPDVQLRIQPMIEFSQSEMQDVDLAIRWGRGNWSNSLVTPFMPLPPYPVGDEVAVRRVSRMGLEGAISQFTLLRDRDDSSAWSDWLTAANLPRQSRKDVLIVPDPNVRVQAVIDGQGIALMDDLVQDDLKAERLFRLSEIVLPDYGYFILQPHSTLPTEAVRAFVDWIQNQP